MSRVTVARCLAIVAAVAAIRLAWAVLGYFLASAFWYDGGFDSLVGLLQPFQTLVFVGLIAVGLGLLRQIAEAVERKGTPR